MLKYFKELVFPFFYEEKMMTGLSFKIRGKEAIRLAINTINNTYETKTSKLTKQAHSS
jgi:hypothetical protein